MNATIINYADSINRFAVRTPKTSYKIVARDDWRPSMRPSEVVEAGLPKGSSKLFKVGVSTRLQEHQFKVTAANERSFDQIGRALAMLPYWEYTGTFGAFHYLRHKYQDKAVRVTLRGSLAVVDELVSDLDAQDKGWLEHGIQFGIYAKADPKMEGAHLILGSTWEFRELLKAQGAHFTKHSAFGPAWRFVGDVPQAVKDVIETTFWSKYHYLVKMLQGFRVFASRGQYSEKFAEFKVLDGYQRELWRIAGLDYHEFPHVEFQALTCHKCERAVGGDDPRDDRYVDYWLDGDKVICEDCAHAELVRCDYCNAIINPETDMKDGENGWVCLDCHEKMEAAYIEPEAPEDPCVIEAELMVDAMLASLAKELNAGDGITPEQFQGIYKSEVEYWADKIRKAHEAGVTVDEYIKTLPEWNDEWETAHELAR